MEKILVFLSLAILVACGGGGGGGGGVVILPPSTQPTTPSTASDTLSFWAQDFSKDASYQLTATKKAEGTHCYIYLEDGQSVSSADIDAIRNEYNTIIYPSDVAAFGSEPNPGIDNDPKVYILLLNIREGFNPQTSVAYTAGYFDPRNEYSLSALNPASNQRELLYMNINPAAGIVPTNTIFYRTMAHEFQHMIHWEQKTHQRNVTDDSWLDEGMATVAGAFCGLPPDYDTVRTYELNPSHSLTNWDGTAANYGVVYMWAQYYKDRVGGNIFAAILQNNLTGIDSVNAALKTIGSPKDFTGTFRDWAVANYSGNAISWPGHPEWSYASINTWPGSYNGVTLPGLFPASRLNDLATALPSLGPWSLNYYSYTPGTPPGGKVTWTPTPLGGKASFIDFGGSSLTFDMVAGTPYSFTSKGYLILQNPSGAATTGSDQVVHSDLSPSPSSQQIILEASHDPVVREMAATTGRPQRVSFHDFFRERELALRATGARPPF